MPKYAPGRVNMDDSEVTAFTSTMSGLHFQLNTTRHLNAVTQAAYSVLSEEFVKQTHGVAAASPEMFHHVYEWQHVGFPGFQLFRTRISGRGGTRTVSWDWLPSKAIVPVDETVEGGPRFRPTEKFNPERLKPIHIFVWKAPMMEYGATVVIRPKLSNVLVYPNPNAGGAGEPVFDPKPRRVDVSEQEGDSVAGNFSMWFVSWWGGPQAQNVLLQSFEKSRDNAFRRAFSHHMDKIGSKPGRLSKKTLSLGTDTSAAAKGRDVARAIAGDLENHYIGEAAARKRRILTDG